MHAYCAISKFGEVFGVGSDPDDAIANTPRYWWRYVAFIIPRTDDVVACYVAGNDVIVRVSGGVADI